MGWGWVLCEFLYAVSASRLIKDERMNGWDGVDRDWRCRVIGEDEGHGAFV